MKLKPLTRVESSLEELSENLLTVEETSKLLRVEPKTIYNWMASKKLRKVKMGGKTFCWKPNVEQLLKKALWES